MPINITKRSVEALSFNEDGKTTYHLDSNLKGFGVRVGKTTKAFFVEKRVNGKPRRQTIGQFPVMSVEEARTEALNRLGDMAKGIDPQEEKRKQEVQETRNQAREAALSITLTMAVDDYLKHNHTLAESTKLDYHTLLRLYLSEWKDTRLIDISEAMVVEKYHAVTVTAKKAGDRAFKKLRAIFNFAINHYRIDTGSNSQNKNGGHGELTQFEGLDQREGTHQASNNQSGLESMSDEGQGQGATVANPLAGFKDSSTRLFHHNPVLVLTENKAWAKKRRRKTVVPRKKLGAWFQAMLKIKATTEYANKATCVDYYLTLLLTGLRRVCQASVGKHRFGTRNAHHC